MKKVMNEKTVRVSLNEIMDNLLKEGNKDGLNYLLNVTGSLGIDTMNQTSLEGLKQIIGLTLKVTPKSKDSNPDYGFKVKNELVKKLLDNSVEVQFDNKNHITFQGLGYKTIYRINRIGSKRLKEYIDKGGKIYYSMNPKSNKVEYYFDKKLSHLLTLNCSKTTLEELKEEVGNKPKRKRVKGGKFGKVKGFNLYFVKDDKLKPSDRKKLLKDSEVPISEVIGSLEKGGIRIETSDVSFLDPIQNDLEIVETWNTLFDKYGYLMSEFKEKWEKEQMRTSNVIEHKVEVPEIISKKKILQNVCSLG